MKKKLTAILALVLMLSLFAGCAGQKSTITLGEYRGMAYTVIETGVTQAEVDAKIESVLADAAKNVEDPSRAGTPVQDGDVLHIDFVGRVDGEEFAGGSSNGAGYDLTIGSGMFIDGFESGLIGKTVGETVDIPATFPDPYEVDESMSGVEAVFEVTIHYVCMRSVPEFTDAFVTELTNGTYTTTADYEANLWVELEQEKVDNAAMQNIDEVVSAVLANCTFDLNDKEMETYAQEYKNYITTMASYYNMDLASYLAATGMTEEQLNSTAAQYGRDSLCTRLMYAAIAKEEGIEVTDAEFDARIDRYARLYGYEGRLDEFAQAYDMEMIRESMLVDLINEKLIEWGNPV